MLAMRDGLPPGAVWAGFGIGAAQFPMVAQAVMLGGHTRVGLEDNLYLERGVPAPSNAALVEKAPRVRRSDRSRAAPFRPARRARPKLVRSWASPPAKPPPTS